MRVAIIGYGPIGYVTAEYLSHLQIPAHIYAGHESHELSSAYSASIQELDLSKSPKLSRFDVRKLAARAKQVYGDTQYSNFCGLEIPVKGGLAYCWGANLAKVSTKYRYSISLDWREAFAFVDKVVPSLTPAIDSIPGSSVYSSSQDQRRLCFYNSSLAVENDCTLCLSCHEDCRFIWGSRISPSLDHKLLNRYVKGLSTNCAGTCTVESVDRHGSFLREEYDLVILSAGAIGSYRIARNSAPSAHGMRVYNKIKHHILLTRLCFAPAFPHRKSTLSMSLFDCFVDLDGYQSYVNFFPLLGALKAALSQSKYSRLTFLLSRSIFSAACLAYVKRVLAGAIYVFLRCFYVANFYYDGSYSSSYISHDGQAGTVMLRGGFRSDVEKVLLKGGRSWRMLLEFMRNGVLVFPVPSLIHPPGADLHHYASLSFVDQPPELQDLLSSKSILVADSSSSSFAPLENPTYYFMARSIVLLRKRLKELSHPA